MSSAPQQIVPMLSYEDGVDEYGGVAPRYRVEDLEGQRWMFIQRD